jgi:hypothetical protein
MNGAEKDYKFGQKNNWRRQIWNEISRRITDRKNALVLYLAGEQDLDRKIAVEHGFRSDNLIIIERDRNVCEKLRDEGKVVINSGLIDVLQEWPTNGPAISLIYGDFCSGLEPDIQAMFDMLEHPSFLSTVMMINLLRGRDSRTNIIRSLITKATGEEKHRGRLIVAWAALELLNVAMRGHEAVYRQRGEGYELSLRTPKDSEMYIFERLLLIYQPSYFSYKSGPLVMDSVIVRNFYGDLLSEIGISLPSWRPFPQDLGLQRKISAALAVRTMRMSGRLPHQPEA